jgi:hypothetical protein
VGRLGRLPLLLELDTISAGGANLGCCAVRSGFSVRGELAGSNGDDNCIDVKADSFDVLYSGPELIDPMPLDIGIEAFSRARCRRPSFSDWGARGERTPLFVP